MPARSKGARMAVYDAGEYREVYERFLTRLANNTESLGVRWELITSDAAIRCGEGILY